jgi:hypothetical protein
MLSPAVDALTALGLATGVTRSATVYALVSAGHVLGIALLLGPILLVDLRMLGRLPSLDAAAVGVLRKTARIGGALAVLTGVLLLCAKPADYVANRVFIAKLLVVAAGLANALAFEWRVRRGGVAALLAHGGAGFAAASLAFWLAALLLGRWIAFV